MNSLEVIFGELGITQYLDAFIDQGFDSWDTILDITESDLDALGVKLGHRRKLQRRIANYRGVAPEASLVSPTCTSIEDARIDSNRTESVKLEKPDGTAVAKRKYRRHPKPDENAPERPPSAYVLFSNKMREDLKGQNLTFTEIAKLVGENWQNLNRDEKEPFERQAHEAKERYNRELAEYKKTTEYRKYYDYLHEFRKRQATQLQEKDVSKRLKLDSDSIRGSSTSGGSAGASGTTSGTVSGSDSQPGSEPPPTRQQRLGSSTSTVDSSFSPGLSSIHHGDELHSPRTLSFDEPSSGRSRGLSSPTSRDNSSHHSGRRSGWADGQRIYGEPSGAPVSWFDPRGIQGTLVHSPDNVLSGSVSSHGLNNISGRISRSGSSSMSRPPSLKTEQSSTGSISSLNSYNIPRTPSDASLPIHALLSSKPEPAYPSRLPPPAPQSQLPIIQPQSGRPLGDQSSSNGIDHDKGFPGHTIPKYSTLGFQKDAGFGTPVEPKLTATSKLGSLSDTGLDGISALLKAREIVDRR
ncbi:hypothetical protein F4813DRAFT_317777 [Daldinia decipiens]|uniref:uncharacterized protein n=1 Tax=Daldinia decipiens TaxID=326647 RepID=UPI0020C2B334|nr:uncharacterized protein F4813DRAFT_317777 [Daldinia decipiens]KAI1660254.1 hypothetical protein F4813DRAFT_317777 [Daldinia decipiens]